MRWKTACTTWFVTAGSDLSTAQRDISSDWIAAYKKYFDTDKPLMSKP